MTTFPLSEALFVRGARRTSERRRLGFTKRRRPPRRYYELFQHAPSPAFITDLQGAIHEANAAALALFRREARHLEHKPIQALVPASAREEFRRQLARLQTETSVSDWRICFNRTGDVPVTVSAAVSFVPGIGRAGAGALYWQLRVAE